jgi:glutamyl-tRNA synthetase
MTVRTRIAPSPTGDPHVGTAYIALFNYAFAKQRGGQFLLRIEDTDQSRCTPESEAAIFEALRWVGLSWDEGPDVGGDRGPYRQSERTALYQEHITKLIEAGHAYKCIRTPEELAGLRSDDYKLKQPRLYPDGYDAAAVDTAIEGGADYTVRLKTPIDGVCKIEDALRGTIEVPWDQVDDQVLVKTDGFPTYHLANVVDDHLMEITHVIRGEEWISSTPKHVHLYDCFGWSAPTFAHLPLLRNKDKSKVSKRKNPVSIGYFREAGYLPDAFVNFLGHMAFTFDDERDVFSLADFVEHFKLEKVSLGAPVFDLDKLLWLNGRYLREQRTDEEWLVYLREQLFSDDYLKGIVPLVKERVEKSEDLVGYAPWLFTGKVDCPPEELLIKDRSKKDTVKTWEALVEKIDAQQDFTKENIEALIKDFGDEQELKPKQLFMPIRWMVCGTKATPPLFDSFAVLGRERVRTRMREAIAAFKKADLPAADAGAGKGNDKGKKAPKDSKN